MIHRAQFEQWVPVQLERVFLFFANPGNLARIMPPATGAELLRVKLTPPPGVPHETATVTDREPLAGVGSEIAAAFRVIPFLPFRAQWIALITEFEWNHHFADVQEKGPFKSFHHRHEFSREDKNGVPGTQIRDVIEYEIGFGILGAVAHRLVVARQLRRIFEYRHQALEKLLR